MYLAVSCRHQFPGLDKKQKSEWNRQMHARGIEKRNKGEKENRDEQS